MIVRNIDIKAAFAGMNQTSQPAGLSLTLLFIKPAEQCFSLTTNQPEQYFSVKFQTSERGVATLAPRRRSSFQLTSH